MNMGEIGPVDRALAAQQVMIQDAAAQTEAMVAELSLPVGEEAWVGVARAAYENAVDGLRSTLVRAAGALRVAERETALARIAVAGAAAGVGQ